MNSIRILSVFSFPCSFRSIIPEVHLIGICDKNLQCLLFERFSLYASVWWIVYRLFELYKMFKSHYEWYIFLDVHIHKSRNSVMTGPMLSLHLRDLIKITHSKNSSAISLRYSPLGRTNIFVLGYSVLTILKVHIVTGL